MANEPAVDPRRDVIRREHIAAEFERLAEDAVNNPCGDKNAAGQLVVKTHTCGLLRKDFPELGSWVGYHMKHMKPGAPPPYPDPQDLVEQTLNLMAGSYHNLFSQVSARLEKLGLVQWHDLSDMRFDEDGRPYSFPSIAPACRALAALIRAEAAKPDDSDWPTVSEAASEQAVDASVISKAASSGKLLDNGKAGRDRRINPASLIRWSLARRDRD